jgi:hypothetical protein
MERTADQVDTFIAMLAITTLNDLLDRHPAYRSTTLSPAQRTWILTSLSQSPQLREAILALDTREVRRLTRRHLHLCLFTHTGAQL